MKDFRPAGVFRSFLLRICGLLLLLAGPAMATANYVYHERTTNDPGSGGQYVTTLNPTSAQTHPLRFKVEYQNYTNQARVYYTTDGSAPSGAFGTATGTSTALTASYLGTFGSPVVDVAGATIPAQPAGTTVKYIISAWHSGGGAEIFANSGEFISPFTTSAQATVFQYTSAPSQYTFTGSGNWSSPGNWANGSVPPATLPSGDTITINGTGACTMDATQTLASGSSMTVNAGKTLNLGLPGGTNLTVNSGATLTVAATGAMSQGRIVNSGTIDLYGSHTIYYFTNNSGAVLNVKSGGVYSNSAGAQTFAAGGTVNNDGTLNFGSGANAGTLNNHAGGLITDVAGGAQLGNSGTLNNAGSFVSRNSSTSGTFNNLATGVLSMPLSCLFTVQSGGSFVNDGILGVTFANDTFYINSGGTLTNNATVKGNGTIANSGTFTNSGTSSITPGASPGKLSVTGPLDLGSTTYTAEINGTVQGSNYDWLAVSGAATLTNANLVVNWGAFTPVAGQSFTVMTFGSGTGSFASVTMPPVPGLVLTTNYTPTAVTVSAALPNTAPAVASDAGSKLFIARYQQNKIARANVDGTGLNLDYLVSTGGTIGVAVDTVGGKLFWTDIGGKIGRANLDGSGANPDFVTGLSSPIGLAVDSLNGHLYIGDASVKRVNLDGTGLTTLIPGLNIGGYAACSDVALDVPNNKLYYVFGEKIGRANLDGSSHNPNFIITPANGLVGLGLDLVNGRIYWAHSGTSMIGRANLDGTNVQNSFLAVTTPRDVIVEPQAARVFWSNGGGVGRANLDGTGVNESFLAGVSGSWGIAVGDQENEGSIATRTGTYSDPDGNTVTFSASVGSVTKTGTSSGTWTWTYTPPDGPATHHVTITANDGIANSTTSFTVNVNNIAPTATFNRSAATANEGTASPPNVSFTGQTDPGTTDVSTGLKYSYDFNNDGTWDDGDGTYAGSLTTASKTIPASYFAAPAPASLTVKGRILDKDGAYSDYTVSLTINHAPTAINGPLTIVEDFDYGTTAGTLNGNGGAGFSTAWNGGTYTPTGLTFSSLTSPGGAWNGSSGSRNFAATLAAAGPITGDFLFTMSSAPPGRVQMFGLGGFNNQGFTIALAPANDSTPAGGVPIVGLNSGGFANITAGAVALNTTYLYRFAYAGSSITAWILSAAQYDNFAPGGVTDAELNAAGIGTGAAQVTGRVTKAGNVTANMANLFTYTFGGGGVIMDRLRMTGTPVGASLVVAENAAVNTSAGTLTPSDADAGNTFTYALASGAGDEDNASFNISGSTVRSSAVFNYEAKSSYSIRVRVTDQGGLTYETPLTVTISNVNEAVTDIALSPDSIAENNAANATVGTLTAIDNDTGDTHAFTLVGGTGSTDNGSFTIAGSALRLTPSANYEAKSSYAIRVRATDTGGLLFEKPLTVTITDVNEAPVASPATYTRAPGTSLKINIASLLAASTSDPDGDARTLQSVGNSTQGASLAIASPWIFYSPANSSNDTFQYTVNDGQGHTATGTISVMVVNPAGANVNFTLNSSNQPVMQFAGVPGYRYTIQRSADLGTWTDIHTFDAPPNGVFSFTDTSPPEGSAFYRMSYTPAP